MPVTYHFKPFPGPGEPHFEVTSKSSDSSPATCTCQKDHGRCSKCRRQKHSGGKQPSQAALSPIKEHPDPIRPGLTPKAIRDKRRASNRQSVAAAFSSAVGSNDYFTLFPHIRTNASSRSDSGFSSPSSRSHSGRRHSSNSSSLSRGSSSDQSRSPSAVPENAVLESEEGADIDKTNEALCYES